MIRKLAVTVFAVSAMIAGNAVIFEEPGRPRKSQEEAQGLLLAPLLLAIVGILALF